jgi:hypothetical protein
VDCTGKVLEDMGDFLCAAAAFQEAHMAPGLKLLDPCRSGESYAGRGVGF